MCPGYVDERQGNGTIDQGGYQLSIKRMRNQPPGVWQQEIESLPRCVHPSHPRSSKYKFTAREGLVWLPSAQAQNIWTTSLVEVN